MSQPEPLRRQSRPGGLIGSLFGGDVLFPNPASGFGMEVTRMEDGYTVEIPVPGYRPGDIDVTFQNDMLIVSGRGERRNFTRSLVVPDEVDPSTITANVAHGMLTLHLGRRPETKARRIAVQSNDSAGTTPISSSPQEQAQRTEIVPGQTT